MQTYNPGVTAPFLHTCKRKGRWTFKDFFHDPDRAIRMYELFYFWYDVFQTCEEIKYNFFLNNSFCLTNFSPISYIIFLIDLNVFSNRLAIVRVKKNTSLNFVYVLFYSSTSVDVLAEKSRRNIFLF